MGRGCVLEECGEGASRRNWVRLLPKGMGQGCFLIKEQGREYRDFLEERGEVAELSRSQK